MAKINLTNLASLQNEASAIGIINANNDALEVAIENTLSRDGTTPNQMTAEFDMNSNRILNLPQPATDNEPVRLADLNAVVIPSTNGNVLGPSSATAGSLVTYSGSSGKLLGTQTLTGIIKTASGVPSVATAGTDYYAPGSTDVAITDGGTGASTALAAYNNLKQAATDTYVGSVELATSAETITGTDTTRAVTPKGFADAVANALLPYSPLVRLYNTQTGTSYTLAASDSGRVVLTTNSSPVTITIPPNSSAAFPLLTQIDFLQYGSGKLTLAQGSGVTISSNLSMKSIAGQFQTATILKIATDAWVMFGSLSA